MPGPRVIVIGAGVVGAALADELGLRGWDDVTVLDQGPLPAPGGSTSHAPGLVFQANSSRTMTGLARYTVEKLGAMSSADGPAFLPVGGLEVATTPERSAELHRRHGWLVSSGVAAELVDAREAVRRHPLLDPELVLGALHTPTDGLVKAVRAVDAQLTRARANGVRVPGRVEVIDVLVSGDRVSGVRTDRGELAADIVVCCAGIWGPKIAGMVGMTLPLTPLAHQLAWTSPVATVSGPDREAVLPILRHQDQDLYYRESFDSLVVGYYGHRPMPSTADQIRPFMVGDPMPSVLAFTPSDFDEAWKQTQALLPVTRTASVADGINGLFSFTTDNMPLMGESAAIKGFWVAEAVWVTHSAGVGRAMAEWLVDGHCASFDLHECDVNRFEPHQLAPAYVLARDSQNFVEVYDIVHPLQPPEDPRPIRQSPFADRQRELGAVFLEANGWERPQWYEANAGLVAGREIPTPDGWAARYWSPIVAAEAQVCRETVAMFDMTALKRLEVTGPGATEYLQHLVTGDVAKSVGAVTYCLLLDVDGGIRSDVTVARLGVERYQVGANGNLDLDWLHRHLPAGSAVQVRDCTPGTTCIGLWGPRARDVVAGLTDDDFSNAGLKYFRGRSTYLGTVPVTALRLSYVGELGWELYTTADHGLALWDLLWAAGREHGVIAAGRGAFTGLRLEKGYRSFGVDMTFEHDPYEAGLGFAVKLDKPDFLGREAVLARKERVRRRLCCLTTGADIVMGKEPVYAGSAVVGYVTSAAFGYTVGAGIAYAWLPAELATPGTALDIAYFDRRIPATVAAEPLVDPGMSRLRGVSVAEALPDHPDFLWHNPEPKKSYDVVIVGGGGHGLATAYYLAKNHGITDVAVLEKGWLAGGNMARNTTIIRSNYLWDASAGIYEHALKLWEGLEADLDYPILFSQRGVLNLAHSPEDVRESVRRVEANRLNGIDAQWLDPLQVKEICPIVNIADDVRHPVMGATYQPRAGIAKHDYVAWGFARRCDAYGIDLIQNCEVTGIDVVDGRAVAVRTTRGRIAAGKIALAAAGHSSVVAAMAGFDLPIQSHPLQALVSELLEPVHPTIVMSNAVHVYVSQAHKGELVMGAGVDSYNSYTQRGAFHVIEAQMAAAVELFPVFARAHVLRTWAGIVDVTPDASAIIGLTPVEGMYVNCGWGTGGFKATPGVGWVYADTIAHGRPHPLAAPFALDRFTTGALVDEHGAAAVAH